MNETYNLLSRDEESAKETTAPRPTDDLTPLVPDRTNAAQIEIRTLVQDLSFGVMEADADYAAQLNAGWEVRQEHADTVVEYQQVFNGQRPRLRTVRTVTLMRLLDEGNSSHEADAEASAIAEVLRAAADGLRATTTVQVPSIVIAPPGGSADVDVLRRVIVGRNVSFAQASADGTYSDGELDALRQFEGYAAFVPVRGGLMDALLTEYALIIERLDALFSKGMEEALTCAERAEIDDLRARALVITTTVARWQMLRQPLPDGAHV